MNNTEVNFDTLLDIPPLRRSEMIPQVRVSASGRVSLNKALIERLAGRWDVCARTSPDYRFLVFLMDDRPNLHFSEKSGYMTHRELAALLKAEEITLPAVYVMEWSEGRRAWVGRCQELSGPPPLAMPAGGGEGKKRRVRRAS